MIQYVVNHVLIPGKINFSHLIEFHIVAVWFLENRVEKHRASTMIHYMMGTKKENMHLPYSRLITKVLKHIDFDLEEEESDNKHT